MKLTHPSLNAGLAVVVSIVTLPIPTTAATAAPPALPAPVGGPATVETPSTVRTIPLHPPQGRALARREREHDRRGAPRRDGTVQHARRDLG